MTLMTLQLTCRDDLAELASEIGSPVGALADLLLRAQLARITPAQRERLRAWAAQRGSRRGCLGGGLRKAEQLALTHLREGVPYGAWVETSERVARAVGVPLRVAYDALVSLQARGRVGSVRSADVDRWGRSVEAVWWALPARSSSDQVALAGRVAGLRTALRTHVCEPGVSGIAAAWLRARTGWSAEALALPDAPPLAEGAIAEITCETVEEWLQSQGWASLG